MVAQLEVEFGRHAIAQTFFHMVVVNVSPHNGSFAQTNDVHKTFVFIAPRLGKAKGDLNVRLCRQTFCYAVAGSS